MASLKKSARSVRAKTGTTCDVSMDGVLELSVTIGYLAADVRKEEMSLVEQLLRDHCVAGVVAMERGDLEQHLHFQMVCRARVTSARSFGVLVRRYMLWYGVKNMSPAGKVTCKVLTNRLIHTWKGMIGYCLKDSGSEHFEVAMFNISDEEVIAGKTLHSIYGKADLKSRVVITNKNVGERAYVWFKYREKRQLTASFLSTLTDMVKSAMFMPAGTWIIPSGGQGMDQKRMNSYWKCMIDPCNISKSEVGDVFVNKRQFFKNRYHDEEEEVSEATEEIGDGGAEGAAVTNTGHSEGTEELQSLPRSLAVPPLGSSVRKNVRVKQEIVGRKVKSAVKKRLFDETPEVHRSRKAIRFSDWPDFVSLKDRAPLPTNVCLPTTEVASGQGVNRDETGEAEFWDDIANPISSASAAEKMFSGISKGPALSTFYSIASTSGGIRKETTAGISVVVSGETSSAAIKEVECVSHGNEDAEKMPTAGVVEENGDVDRICLSSDNETESCSRKRSREVITISSDSEGDEIVPAAVFEDRKPFSTGPYFAAAHKISLVKVKREFPCNYYKCYSEHPGECACVR